MSDSERWAELDPSLAEAFYGHLSQLLLATLIGMRSCRICAVAVIVDQCSVAYVFFSDDRSTQRVCLCPGAFCSVQLIQCACLWLECAHHQHSYSHCRDFSMHKAVKMSIFFLRRKKKCVCEHGIPKWILVLECASFRDFSCSQYFLKNIWKWEITSYWLNMPLLACEAFLGSILGLGLCVIGLLGLLVHCYGVD